MTSHFKVLTLDCSSGYNSFVLSPSTDCNNNPPFEVKVGEIDFYRAEPDIKINKSAIAWPSGKAAPLDSPPCGFDGMKCRTSTTVSSATPRTNVGIGRFKGALSWIISISLNCQNIYLCQRKPTNDGLFLLTTALLIR